MEINFTKILKHKKLNLTSVRMALLDVLHHNPHSDANRIFELVHNKIPTTSIQSIYNNLKSLVHHGVIREIKPKGHVSIYETRIDDNHHHVICRNCGLVVDTDCKSFAPCLTPVNSHGFTIDEAEVTFWGICPECNDNQTKKER